MRRSWLMAAAVLSVFVLAGGGVLTGSLSGQERRGQRRGKAEAPTPQAAVAPADQRPTTAVLPAGIVALRVRFGSKPIPGQEKREPTKWDGQLTVTGGRLHELRLWREDPRDAVEGNRWTLSTRHNTPWSSEERKKGHEALPVGDTALIVELADTSPATRLAFDTVQGKFEVRLEDVPWGTNKVAMPGLVQISRMAVARTILSAPTEDDFPSAALDRSGRLCVAYVAFTHGRDFRVRDALSEEPKSLDNLDQPTGGDQVLLLRLEGDRWVGPLPVTPPGQDVFRTALAVDGAGKVWVFWTAKNKAGWDLYARALDGDRWLEPIQLTNDPEPDAFPVATTDSTGRVWLAWQAFRGGNANVLALRQEGSAFGRPITVADGKANEWAPAIAASTDGQVAVAWDTYAKGDYDV